MCKPSLNIKVYTKTLILISFFIILDECVDKGEQFCKPYAPYCKQIKEGGPFKAFMEKNCCDSCGKLKPTSKED